MKVMVIFYHIFSRFCMFCALLGQDIRGAYRTFGPLINSFKSEDADQREEQSDLDLSCLLR